MFLTAAIAAPQVSNVSMSYDGSGAAKITYDLSGDSGIVLLDIKSGGISIGDAKVAQAVGETEVTITCEGANEAEAAAGIQQFLEENL